MSNFERLTYRSSKQAISFAWRTVILAIIFGSAVFIILPLSTIKSKKEEKVIFISSAPEMSNFKITENKVSKSPKKSEATKKVEQKPLEKKLQIPEVPKIPKLPVKPAEIKLEITETKSPKIDKVQISQKFDFKVKEEVTKTHSPPQSKTETGRYLLLQQTSSSLSQKTPIRCIYCNKFHDYRFSNHLNTHLNKKEVIHNNDKSHLSIFLKEDGKVLSKGKVISPDKIQNYLSKWAGNQNTKVIILVDKNASRESLSNLKDKCKRLGLKNIITMEAP